MSSLGGRSALVTSIAGGLVGIGARFEQAYRDRMGATEEGGT